MRMSLSDFESLLEANEEIWSGDILWGGDFIFIIDGVRSVGSEIVIDLAPFELLNVIHGNWDYDERDFVEARDGDLGTIQQPMGSEGSNEDNKGFSWGDLVDVEIELSVEGSLNFPVKWVDEARFMGRISRWGRGIGTDYTCKTYTEVRTRRRFVIVGPRVESTHEVEPENFCIDYILVRGYFGVEHDLEVSLKPTASLEFKRGPEDPIAFHTFYIPIGTLPFNVRVSPYWQWGFSAKVEGALEWAKKSGASLRVPIGFEWDPHNSDGLGLSLLPNENFEVQYQRTPMEWTELPPLQPEFSVEASIKAFGELGVVFGLGAGHDQAIGAAVKGPRLGGQLAAEAVYNPLEPACLRGDVYFKAYGKAELKGQVSFGRWSWGVDLVGGAQYDLFKTSLLPGGPLESDGYDYCLVSPTGPQDLKVTLEWDSTTDLDLYVEHPTHGRIFYGRRDTPDGAVYFGDNCINQECDDETAVEVIEWVNGAPEPGTYQVWAVNFGGSSAANYTIVVETEHGVLESFSGSIGAAHNSESPIYEFVIPEE